jgi:putative transposase
VDRNFARSEPDCLGVTDIADPGRQGVLRGRARGVSRRVVGWSIDPCQTAALVTNALGMAIGLRNPTGETVIHFGPRLAAQAQAVVATLPCQAEREG